MAATLQNIQNTILSGKFSNAELDDILRTIQSARSSISRVNAMLLQVGNKVTFSSRGVNYSGTIESIKIKNASVRCSGTLYRVPMNMLTAVK